MVITLTNHKGGVLKTTIAVNIVKFFSVDHKKKTVLIDIDKQGNVAIQFGYDLDYLKRTLADYLKNWKIDPLKCGAEINPNLNLIFSNLEFALVDEKTKIVGMRKLLEVLKKKFEIIVIDSSPAVNSFEMTLWEQSDKIIIPVRPEPQAVKGTLAIFDSIEDFNVKKGLEIYPVWTAVNKRSILHKEISDDIKTKISQLEPNFKKIKVKWFPGQISQSIQNETAVAYQKLPLSFIKTTKNKNVQEFASLSNFLLTGKVLEIDADLAKDKSTKKIKKDFKNE